METGKLPELQCSRDSGGCVMTNGAVLSNEWASVRSAREAKFEKEVDIKIGPGPRCNVNVL